MSTERTDQYPEVSGDDAGIVPPQGGPKQEWPKKIRTLTATELDRLTIDGLGRFYWDGQLVNYAGPNQVGQQHLAEHQQKPIDLDQHAMDLLDRTAREISDPNSIQPAPDASAAEAQPAPSSAPELAATPSDQLAPEESVATIAPETPAAPAPATPTPVVELRRQQVLMPSATAHSETVRVTLSRWQSIGAILAILALVAGGLGIALSGLAVAHEWGCKVGLVQSYCPPPPPEPKVAPRPDIPL
jgi:hypothetical protein